MTGIQTTLVSIFHAQCSLLRYFLRFTSQRSLPSQTVVWSLLRQSYFLVFAVTSTAHASISSSVFPPLTSVSAARNAKDSAME